MHDQCTCSGVDQASSRVAGSKSKGNFLSGGGGGGGVCVYVWVCVCGGGSSRPFSGLAPAGVCMLVYMRARLPVCACACVGAWMSCIRESNCKREKDRVVVVVVCVCVCVCAHTHTHTDSFTHIHGARFDCTQQGIHYCFHESMGKCTPTMYGDGCCLHNRVWVNAHSQPTAMDVAFTTEYGCLLTHDALRVSF